MNFQTGPVSKSTHSQFQVLLYSIKWVFTHKLSLLCISNVAKKTFNQESFEFLLSNSTLILELDNFQTHWDQAISKYLCKLAQVWTVKVISLVYGKKPSAK